MPVRIIRNTLIQTAFLGASPIVVPQLDNYYAVSSEHFCEDMLYADGVADHRVLKVVLDVLERLLVDAPTFVIDKVVTPVQKGPALNTRHISPHWFGCAVNLTLENVKDLPCMSDCCWHITNEYSLPARQGWRIMMQHRIPTFHVDFAPLITKAAYRAELIPFHLYKSWQLANTEW